jgi:hypothetical protein
MLEMSDGSWIVHFLFFGTGPRQKSTLYTAHFTGQPIPPGHDSDKEVAAAFLARE